MKYLITGCAGFIGFHLAKKLLKQNNYIVGIDNLNQYYDVKIKKKRLNLLKKHKNFKFIYGDLKKKSVLSKIKKNINYIYHFAGQAGVRYSIEKPSEYIKDNIIAYLNLLEYFKDSKKIKTIFYASSSSVYGNTLKSNSNISLNKPISVYAVSKLSMELLSHVYLHLYNLKCVGLRFFTVYGPWGRPDMAYFKFCKLIAKNKKIEIYNNGNHIRSFTYIDDIINNILILKRKVNKINFKKNSVFNLGNSKTESLNRLVKIIETNLSKKSKKIFRKKQMGDVLNTKSNNLLEKKLFKFKYETNLSTGIKKFTDWFLNDYEKKN